MDHLELKRRAHFTIHLIITFVNAKSLPSGTKIKPKTIYIKKTDSKYNVETERK